jgi:simple sugar transport system permease protein
VAVTSSAYRATLPFLSEVGLFNALGFMVYLALIIAVVTSIFLGRTHKGLNLRAVGENPATADAAGISVVKNKYLATCTGSAITGLGGLYYVMDYIKGTWAIDGGIEKLGWLAVLPYLVTIVVLIIVSTRRKREHQPPASLGLPYFREER